MARRSAFPTIVAMPALIALPALAQTMSSRTPAPTAPGAAVTAPTGTSPASPTAMPTTSMNSGSSSSFETADQQIRASKLIGSSVYNDQNQKIGSVDELLVDQNHDVTGAVLSVGRFLGMGSKLMKVPYSDLRVLGSQVVMAGATKQQLTQMPSYDFFGPT